MKVVDGRLGFTMIEILVVLMIIAVLSTLGVNSFAASQMKARDLIRKTDLANMAKPLEAYFNDHGEYPTATHGFIGGDDGEAIAWGEALVDANGTVYVTQLPEDPRFNQYFYQSDGDQWALYALLENAHDPDIQPVYANTDCTDNGDDCNFRVTSTNFSD